MSDGNKLTIGRITQLNDKPPDRMSGARKPPIGPLRFPETVLKSEMEIQIAAARKEAFDKAAAIVRDAKTRYWDSCGTIYGDASYKDVFEWVAREIESEGAR